MSDLIDDPREGQNMPEFTVTQVSGAVKRALEDRFGRIRVRGEVGRVFRARSGHLYYDVKDDRNVLACTTWKGQISGLGVQPEEGLEVVVTGRLTAFGAQSKYNLNVDSIAVAGQGALMAMLEKRRRALAAEGLFDTERKRELPYLPEVIGVITSPSGAVIRDILHRLRDRFPRKVLVWPVAVQGAGCAPEVARAIEGFNALAPGGALPRPDLLIVARGGGSIEDLWGFNEEIVVRAAAASEIPLISAVGHETDTTLIDHAADRRAPTPTAAAEMAVPVRLDLIGWLDGQAARLLSAMTRMVGQRGQRLRDLARALPRPETLLETPRQRLDIAAERLPAALTRGVERRRLALIERAGALRPQALRASVAAKADRLAGLDARLAPGLARRMRQESQRLERAAARLDPQPLRREIDRQRQRLDAAGALLAGASTRLLEERRGKLEALDRLRETLGYKETLARGYAVVHGGAGIVTTQAQATDETTLEIEFADGRLAVNRAGTAPRRRQGKPDDPPPGQGSLF